MIINYLKISLKVILGCIEFFIAFISTYLTIALWGMAIHIGTYIPEKNGVEIFMKSDGVHTDFVLPVKTTSKDWSKTFLRTYTKSNDSTKQHISIGWGDQGFFLNTPQWSDLTFETAFNAAFYRGKSAIHTNYILEKDILDNKKRLVISKRQYLLLCTYIEKSIVYNSNHSIAVIPNRGYWDNDCFYQSKGSYGLFSTCNSWINSGLLAANLQACLWTPFNSGIFANY